MVLKKAILNYENFEVIAVYDENLFKGFCVLANHKNISHILFIAINKKIRGNNLGSKLLKYVCETKKDKVILADLEVPNNHCFDNSRERRIKFYVKNGFKKSRINYIWNNDEFYIYEKNGEVSEKSFWDFFSYLQKTYNLPDEFI